MANTELRQDIDFSQYLPAHPVATSTSPGFISNLMEVDGGYWQLISPGTLKDAEAPWTSTFHEFIGPRWTGGGEKFADLACELTYIAGSSNTDDIYCFGNADPSTKDGHYARVRNNTLYVGGTDNNTDTTVNSVAISALTVGTRYRLWCRATGSAGAKAVAAWLTTDAAPTTIISNAGAELTGTNANASIAGTGVSGFGTYNSSGGNYPVRMRWFGIGADANKAGWANVYPTPTAFVVELVLTSMVAAVSTIQWYWNPTPVFTSATSTAVLLGTGSYASLSPPSGVTSTTLGFIVAKVTDGSANVAYSNEVACMLQGPALKVGFFGDSYFEKYTSPLATWITDKIPDRVARRLRGKFPGRAVTIYNGGVSGSTIAADWLAGAGYLASKLPSIAGYDYLIIEFGLNDMSTRTAAQFRSDLTSMISAVRVQEPNIKIIILYPNMWNPTAQSGRGTSVMQTLLDFRDSIDAQVSGNTIVNNSAKRIFELQVRRQQVGMMDCLHPNEAQSEDYASCIADAIHEDTMTFPPRGVVVRYHTAPKKKQRPRIS